MVTDQVRIKSLYAGLYRTIILLGLLMAAAWLFALFSYYLSRKTGTDWFTRSGSMMSLIGAAITFRQVNFYQSALATALNEGLVSIPKEIELRLKPPTSYRVLSYLGYLTGIIGTGIWGYGDLLLRLVPWIKRHDGRPSARRRIWWFSLKPVFAGMITASAVGIFVIPMLYVTFQSLRERSSARLRREEAPSDKAAWEAS
jgi:hypothetical protein